MFIEIYVLEKNKVFVARSTKKDRERERGVTNIGKTILKLACHTTNCVRFRKLHVSVCGARLKFSVEYLKKNI